MKLEEVLHHYLGTDLEMQFVEDGSSAILTGIMDMGKPHVQVKFQGNHGMFYYSELKPVLFDLSMLTEEIEHNGKKFIPVEKLFKLGFTDLSDGWEVLIRDEIYLNTLQWGVMKRLFEWHFNLFLPNHLYIKKLNQ